MKIVLVCLLLRVPVPSSMPALGLALRTVP